MGNVPNLRFPEFSGEWKETSLSSYAKKITKKNKGNIISNVLCNSANLGIIPQSDYFDRDIANNENTNTYYVIENGDFVYNPRKSVTAPYGPVNMYLGDKTGIISPLYLCFSVKDIYCDFLLHWFKGNAWHRYVYSHGDTGVRFDRVSIKDDIFLNMPIKVPVYEEQIRISKLLRAIDERIATQNKIIEDLKKLKSAIMATIFGKSNVAKSQWREVKLGNICERVTRRNSNNMSKLILTIAAQHGLVSQTDFFNKSVASTDLSNYFLLNKGDFAYNKSYSTGYPFGAIKRLDRYDRGVLSSLYICFSILDGVDSDFLVQYFETSCWHKEISMIAVEGARNHGLLNISVSDFFETYHWIPSYDEQVKIGEFLGKIDEKINKEQEKLDSLNEYKKGLLQKMFV